MMAQDSPSFAVQSSRVVVMEIWFEMEYTNVELTSPSPPELWYGARVPDSIFHKLAQLIVGRASIATFSLDYHVEQKAV